MEKDWYYKYSKKAGNLLVFNIENTVKYKLATSLQDLDNRIPLQIHIITDLGSCCLYFNQVELSLNFESDMNSKLMPGQLSPYV